MTYYVLLDAVGIQRTIFETNKLRVIAGASVQLAQWQIAAAELLKNGTHGGGRMISSAGGNLLAAFDGDTDADAVAFAKAGADLARKSGFDAAWAVAADTGHDKETWDALQLAIARYKAGDREPDDYGDLRKPIDWGNSSKSCVYCGIRPADTGTSNACAVCQGREEAANLLFGSAGALGNTPIGRIYGLASERDARFPEDLENIVQRAPDRLEDLEDLAVVAIDLNNLGAAVRDTITDKGFSALEDFSRNIEKDLVEVYRAAIQETFPLPADGVFRCRPLLCAGDDAVFALPASKWPAFVQTICEKLKDKDRAAGVGVIVAKYNFPLSRLILMAEELVARAKNRARWERTRDAGFNECVVDWHHFQESAIAGIGDTRQRHYVREIVRSGMHAQATQRPYTATEFSELLARSNQFWSGSELAERKRFSLYTALRDGPETTRDTLTYEFLRDESPELTKYPGVWAALKKWKDAHQNDTYPLWVKHAFPRGDVLVTGAADEIELYWTAQNARTGRDSHDGE